MLKLSTWKLSPNAFKVRVVLYELGFAFENHEVEILTGAGQQAAFLALNPNGKVPVLEDDALVIWESNAIALYLARKAGRLLPEDIAGQALVDQWLFWQSAHYYQPVVILALEKMIKPMFNQTPDSEQVAAQVREFQRHCQVLEQHLAQYEWLAGELSVADFSVASTLFPRQKLGLDISGYRFLGEWLAKIESRDSWQKAKAE